MNISIFMSILWTIHVCIAKGQSECSTGRKSQCIPICECERLLKLAQEPNRKEWDLKVLETAKCGYEGNVVKVCCPVECTTPDGEDGKCVNIYSCPQLAYRLRPPISDEDLSYLKKSQCEGTDPYNVCCGSIKTEKRFSFESIDSMCTSMQSIFPPNPSSDCCGLDSSVENKIAGGNRTAIDMYPWLAVIEYQRLETAGNALLCGGALISARYVLTAAHCIDARMMYTFGIPAFVRLGEYDTTNEGDDCVEVDGGGLDCTNGAIKINIDNLIVHPQHNPTTKKNDIGLIRLSIMAPFNEFIRPICLPTKDITYQHPLTQDISFIAAGWGTNSDGFRFSPVKLHVTLPYVELENCQRELDKSGSNKQGLKLWDLQICAGGEPGKDSCKGDSGGPLMYKNSRIFELHGIVSFGPRPCGKEHQPGVYTKVFPYIDWITNTIADNN